MSPRALSALPGQSPSPGHGQPLVGAPVPNLHPWLADMCCLGQYHCWQGLKDLRHALFGPKFNSSLVGAHGHRASCTHWPAQAAGTEWLQCQLGYSSACFLHRCMAWTRAGAQARRSFWKDSGGVGGSQDQALGSGFPEAPPQRQAFTSRSHRPSADPAALGDAE